MDWVILSYKKVFSSIVIGVICAAFGSASFVFASETDGTIDAVDKHAWSENAGWIDFGATTDAVHITDTLLTGSIYGENIGWIVLDPTPGGVQNNSEGNLSGYAWGENVGWVDFSPVTIGTDGVFSGAAYSENIGWITFGTANNRVQTDWRPVSARVTTTFSVPVERTTSRKSGSTSITGQYQNLLAEGNIEAANKLKAEWSGILSGPSTQPPAGSIAYSHFTTDLKTGSLSEDVKRLQQFLNRNGFTIASSGVGSMGQETTYFGKGTYEALVRYQVSAGILPATGYFGPLTRSAMSGSVPTAMPVSTAASTQSARNFGLGMQGEDVRTLQILLIKDAAGAASTALASYGSTGYFGPATLSALKEFQAAHGILPATGYFGPKTKAFIQSISSSH